MSLPPVGSGAVSLPEGMLDTLRDGVVVVGADKVIKYVNPSYYDQFGVTPETISPGDALRDVLLRLVRLGRLGPVSDETAEEYVDERLARWGSAEGRVERRFLNTGRILDIYRSMTLEDDVVSVHVDVTRAVQSEREIERQRVYMTSLLEHMSDGLALLDGDGRFVMFNQQFLDLYDIDSARVHWGMEYDPFVREIGDLARMSPQERDAEIRLRRDFAFDPTMTTARRRLGNGRTLNINKTNLPGGGCVMTTRDMTAQLEREEELTQARIQAEESARSKSEFVARMSHEMRTPLNGILGVAALLDTAGLSPQHADFVRIINTSGQVLLRLIDDILDLSRMDAETFEVVEEPFRFEDLLHECIGTIEPSTVDKNLQLSWPQDTAHLPALLGDAVRIKQILLNLLNNAVKFTERGSIGVSLTHDIGPEGATLTLSVSDTGVGIAPAQLDQIFDRFFQIDGTVTRKYGGAGLGLAITRKLVDAMGGTIQVKSAPGKGTTFYIRLTLQLA